MNENEELIRAAAREAAAEATKLHRDELQDVVAASVKATLTSLGISVDNPIEMQKDFQHLRDWRESVTKLREKTVMTAVGFIITGLLGAAWLGFKTFMGK